MLLFFMCHSSWRKSCVVLSPAQRQQSCYTCSPNLMYRWEENVGQERIWHVWHWLGVIR